MRADGGAPVFLTGATGFIGGRLAAALVARGCRLRCLVRSRARAAGLAELGAELVVGDITDAGAVTRGLEGASLAFHLAGLYEVGRVDAGALERANVEGTRVFLEAARQTQVPLSVYASSVVALGPVDGAGRPLQDPYRGPYPSVYHRTKTAAHHVALAAQREGLPLINVCPAYVYGPGDAGPAAQHLENVLRKRLPALATTPAVFSYVHVDDVVAAMIAAAERNRPGATYILGGESASVNEFTRMAGRLAGTWVTPLRAPFAVVLATGALMDAVSRVTGWRAPISAEHARIGARGERWDPPSTRAIEELDYAPRPLAEGLPGTVQEMQRRIAR